MMATALFIRLLEAEDKAAALAQLAREDVEDDHKAIVCAAAVAQSEEQMASLVSAPGAAGIDAGLTVIMMMKRGNLKYRFQNREYTASMLYGLAKRRMRPLARRSRYSVTSLLVELDLQTDSSKPQRWVQVRLVFSKLRTQTNNAWVVLLCSDPGREPESILRTYALRWGIEVYFKEAKQNLGLLREQTGCYVVHYASVHLTAMRFALLFCALQSSGGGMTWGQMREGISRDLIQLSFARMTWEMLKAVLYGVLDSFRPRIGDDMANDMAVAINQAIEEFLQAALQIDDGSVAAAWRQRNERRQWRDAAKRDSKCEM